MPWRCWPLRAGMQRAGQRGLGYHPTSYLRNEHLPHVQHLQVLCKREMLQERFPQVRWGEGGVSESLGGGVAQKTAERSLLSCLQSVLGHYKGRWGVAESNACAARKGEQGLLLEGI